MGMSVLVLAHLAMKRILQATSTQKKWNFQLE